MVNGGIHLLAYLLFLPHHAEAAAVASEEYRKRLYPFKQQREAKFRSSIGPTAKVTLSKNVIANLEFMNQLSASNASRAASPNKPRPNRQFIEENVCHVWYHCLFR